MVSAVREHAPTPPRDKVRVGSNPYVSEEDEDFLRQALADAIVYRAMAAVNLCPACAIHPALLCVAHAAELDWVSAYRVLLAAKP